MMKLTAIVLSLISLACSDVDNYTTSGLSERQIELAQCAAQVWCDKIGKCADIDPSIDGTSELIGVIEMSPEHTGDGGLTYHKSLGAHKIVMLNTMPDNEFYETVLHELGHTFGCHTHQSAGNIMSAPRSVDTRCGDNWLSDLDIACAMNE